MPDYSNFSADDFALDPYFREGVLYPTAETRQFWSNFRLLHPEQEKALEQAQSMVRALEQARPSPNIRQLEQEWDLLDETIRRYERRRTFGPLSSLVQYRVAASIALCLLLGGIWWYTAQPTVRTYTTDFNETQTISLPDGSAVTLNANSTLSFHDNWQTSPAERQVTLEGEAFFAVEKKRIHHPDSVYFSKFIVQTTRLRIEVLGTRFNVNDHVPNTQVALESGKVLVRNQEGEALYLAPGEMAELIAHRLHKKATDVEQYISWKDNKLIFKETPVPEILKMLENRYGYHITYRTDHLANKRYTGSNPADDVDLLLYKLSKLYGLSIQQEGKNLTLTPNRLR